METVPDSGAEVGVSESNQLFPTLEPAVKAALRASIERFGVLVPIVLDGDGHLLDGHHRRDIAVELGVTCPATQVPYTGDEAVEVAKTLNLDRRHLSTEQRREMAVDLRIQGHSLRAIGGALGVDPMTVRKDLSIVEASTMPDRIRTSDGRGYPSRRPKLGDRITDSYGDEREIVAVEQIGEELVLLDKKGDCIIVPDPDAIEEDVEDEEEIRPLPITKPDLGGGVSHPARFSDGLLPVFADLLAGYKRILDPFAGTGRIHELQAVGFETVGVELEPEWAALHPATEVGDARKLRFSDGEFDAICTSPTYGNRLADHHNAYDPEARRSYTHDLGRSLHKDNSGAMQWGGEYRAFHEDAWAEAVRVLQPGGRLVLNIKDHIRGGEWQDVAGWHIGTLCAFGLSVAAIRPIVTRHLQQGTNADLRVGAELVIALDKDDES